MSAVLTEVTVDEGLNFRTVTASASSDLNTFFLHISGIDELTAPALSSAEEKISNVEISMVLDVSGSMAGNRLTNMKDAAAEFVDTVIQPTNGTTGLTTVSLVPYNATVSLGDTVASYFSLSNAHAHSNCPIFSSTAFDETSIDPDETLDKIAHFDPYNYDYNSNGTLSDPWCVPGDSMSVMVHSADANALKTRISSLWAQGNTAIDLGMKWGVGLLDPDVGGALVAMASDDLVVADAADRPASFDDSEAIKFVVVMTDGQNTTQYDLKSKYKSGWSDLWVNDRNNSSASDDHFSLLVDDNWGSSNDVYFWKRYENSSWNSRNRSTPDGGSNADRLSNADLFARFPTASVARSFYVRPYYDGFVSYSEYYDMYYAYEAQVSGGQANDRLSRICSAAKDAGIVVFAIAFEAPEDGQEALQDCASSASHYFDVEGVEITETFHAIARQINSLRLVQ